MSARGFLVTTRYTAAIIITLLMFFPMYWLLITSLKSPEELKSAIPTFWPERLAWENYADAFRAAPFGLYAWNTLVQTVGIVVLQLNVSLLAAYAFAKGNFRGREFWFYFVIAALIVPDQVTFVPVYVMMAKLDWLNTFLALIIPNGVSAYSIFLLRQSFKSLNNDVLEAAKVDGANRFHLIYGILVPMAFPTVVTVVILKFIGGWNSYFWPLIMTNTNDMRVLTVGIAMMKNSVGGSEMLNWHLLMAGSIIVIAPIVLLFVVAQKYIVAAMSHSTFK